MDSNTKLILLYDYYGELLTNKQKIYFEDYYFNNLTLSEITNEENNIYRNPITGEIHTDSFLELYEKSIDMSLKAIQEVNKTLYDNYSIDRLENIFENLSYDTGVIYPLIENMPYVRRKSTK